MTQVTPNAIDIQWQKIFTNENNTVQFNLPVFFERKGKMRESIGKQKELN